MTSFLYKIIYLPILYKEFHAINSEQEFTEIL